MTTIAIVITIIVRILTADVVAIIDTEITDIGDFKKYKVIKRYVNKRTFLLYKI